MTEYPLALLQKADDFVARQRTICPTLGSFANSEMSKALAAGRLAEWLSEVSA
jgi:hypothetical protein